MHKVNISDLLYQITLGNSSVNAAYSFELLLRGLGISELPKIFTTLIKIFSASLCYTQKCIKSSKIAKKSEIQKYLTKTEKNSLSEVKTGENGRISYVVYDDFSEKFNFFRFKKTGVPS